jgi:hypothetical protein
MSNTGRTKKLASFNCDQKMWEQFIARCREKGTTATATLTQFIEFYLDDDRDDLDAIGGKDLDKRLDSRIKVSVEEYLAASNPEILAICSRLDQMESQLLGESHSNEETPCCKSLADLEQKVEGMTARMTQFTEAIMKILSLSQQPTEGAEKILLQQFILSKSNSANATINRIMFSQETWCNSRNSTRTAS